MKSNWTNRTMLFVSMLVILLVPFTTMALAPMHSVFAPPVLQVQTPPTILDVILKIAMGFASLVGVASLVAVLVQFGKFFGLVKDDTAAQWTAGLNLLGFIVLVYFGVFQPQIAIEVLDGYAAQIAMIALFVLGFIVQMTTSKPIYNALKSARVPLLSYSHSG